MEPFIVFVLAVIVWMALGSWDASILTRKRHLRFDGPCVVNSSELVRRPGPILLIVAVALPQRS